MKNIIVILYVFCLANAAIAQVSWPDSMKHLSASAKDDRTKFSLLIPLVTYYTFSKPDSAITYVQEQISLAKKNKSDSLLSTALTGYGAIFSITGNYPQAIYFVLEGLKAAERAHYFGQMGWCYANLASTYLNAGDFGHALFYADKEKSLGALYSKLSRDSAEQTDFKYLYSDAMSGLATIYDKLNQPDSALKYMQMADSSNIPQYKWIDTTRLYLYGNIYLKRGDYLNALKYYRGGYKFAVERRINGVIMSICNGLARTFWKMNQPDSSIYYANNVLETSKYAQNPLEELAALDLLAEIYKSKGETDSAFKYVELTLATKDSLFNQQKVMQMQSMTFNEQLRQQDILEAQKAYQNRIKTYILVGGLVALLLIAFILFRSNRQKQKANKKIEKAYQELKSTQAQLIQSEKMASLGQLTAGIAHEIQNPLNFVNNFSEVNKELIEELEEEAGKGNVEEVKAIAKDLKENEQKIIHHGRRAGSIVKSMLEHSRMSTGKKELTDINALVDECVRLSYHGMRAKKKVFNAIINTSFDESLSAGEAGTGKINVIPQDISRVLLNLFNNAFYAVNEKKANLNGTFEPTVSVCTKRQDGKVEIQVQDNGNGIPPNITDKIFQPFFTTKPTGQGTGLGLSLSYDIIKAHGGNISVESKEGEGSTFLIQLPLNIS